MSCNHSLDHFTTNYVNNFEWKLEHQKRFAENKKILGSKFCMLKFPGPDQTFNAMCDASNFDKLKKN